MLDLHLPDTKTLLLLALVWIVAAYVIVPQLWARHFRRHPFFEPAARLTETGDGHPGDPINIGLVGSEDEVLRAMAAAGWFPADPITLASSARIAADTVLRRTDDDAPVSNLFLFGRKQDLAFEQPLTGGPGKRHHVRFWRWDALYEGRDGWFGAATFDASVGLSHHDRADHPSHRARCRRRARPPRARIAGCGIRAESRMEGRVPCRVRGAQRRRRSLAYRRAAADRDVALRVVMPAKAGIQYIQGTAIDG